MEDKILGVLGNVNDELLTYTGQNMVEDGIVNSLDLIMMISELEDTFRIEIDAEDVTEENFGNKDRIIALIKRLIEKNS